MIMTNEIPENHGKGYVCLLYIINTYLPKHVGQHCPILAGRGSLHGV